MSKRLPILPNVWKWFVGQQRTPMDTIYHYTSKRALLDILKRKQMWATDLRFMNDPEELTYSHQLMEEVLISAATKEQDQQRVKWLLLFGSQFRKFVSQCRWYSVSFCQEVDLGTQWRDYGGEGQGFALGWSIDTLPSERPMQIEIEYDHERQLWLIRKILGFHVVALRAKRKLSSGRGLQEMLHVSGSLANCFNVLLYNFKGKSWAKEREIRYVYQTLDDQPPAGKMLKYRPAGQIEKPYIESDFSAIPLRVVIAGPLVDDTTFWEIRRALNSCGYADTPMYRSTTPVPGPAGEDNLIALQSDLPQPQRVSNHSHRTERHRGAGDHRT